MKELKKISLKKEIDREAEQIEKEISERTDLDDIKVSVDMETSLFNKIQDYEYDRRTKTVYHKKKKRYIIVGLAAVLVLVFGSAITGVGSKSYWKVVWNKMVGEEKAEHIDVEKMDTEVTEDIDEIQIYKEIRNQLGIPTVRLEYLPGGTALKEYELDNIQKKATLLYKCKDEIIKYSMYMNNTDSSLTKIEPDKLLDEYHIKTMIGASVDVKEYSVSGKANNRYIAQFEYMDAQYEIKGIMEKEEFNKIIENLFFYE